MKFVIKKHNILAIAFLLMVNSSIANDREILSQSAAEEVLPLAIEPEVSEKISSKLYVDDTDSTETVQVMVRLREYNSANSFGSAEVQERFIERLSASAPSAKIVGRTRVLLNAVFVEVERNELEIISEDYHVQRVVPVGTYEMQLSDTVPYVGAQKLQRSGHTGENVRIAVLDSGIDYTHASLSGEGTTDAYLKATEDLSTPDSSQFPNSKVVGGYDFVGDKWPYGPIRPDDDPIDIDGHGTHVADIIAGVDGMAPDAELYAVAVCSSVSSSCNGMALLLGMEFAVDPNGDGDASDRVDIINISVGADYGQPFDDDLSAAIDVATQLGVLTVAAAGNGGDSPFKVSTPAAAPTALAVGQTAMPNDFYQIVTIAEPDSSPYDSEFNKTSWSGDLTTVTQGMVIYGNGRGAGLKGCDVEGKTPYSENELAGRIVLVDFGGCTLEEKVLNVENAGANIVLIGFSGASDPHSFLTGNPSSSIPAYYFDASLFSVLSEQDTNLRFDPDRIIPLVGSMVGTSSRGPDFNYLNVKPEVVAPGGSYSALAGSGDKLEIFGGTSGATPLVTGAAALLKSARPELSAMEIKRALISNAENNIVNYLPEGGLAPVTRIGGGELRVENSLNARLDVRIKGTENSILAFGYQDLEKARTFRKTMYIKNISTEVQSIDFKPDFRYTEDAELGAIEFFVKPNVQVGPGNTAEVPFYVTVYPEKLQGNFLNSGIHAASGDELSRNEFDGYLTLNMEDFKMNIPWHILPRKASAVKVQSVYLPDGDRGRVNLVNEGAGLAQLGGFTLLSVSEDIPEGAKGEEMQRPDIRAVGVRTITRMFPTCTSDFAWQFALNSWERQTLALGARYRIFFDIDQDGFDDFELTNLDLSYLIQGHSISYDGRQMSAVIDLSTGQISASFYIDHATNSSNTMLIACGEQMGLSFFDYLTTNIDVRVEVAPTLINGSKDTVEGITISPLGERYFPVTGSDFGAGYESNVVVVDFGDREGQSEALGLMIVSNSSRGDGANGGATLNTETLLVNKEGVEIPVSQKCGEAGLAYVSDDKMTAFVRDQGWTASFAYMCIDNHCVPSVLKSGYYQANFPGALGEHYNLEFKVQTVDGFGQEIIRVNQRFTNNSCLLSR